MRKIELIIASYFNITSVKYTSSIDTIILLKNSECEILYKELDYPEAGRFLLKYITQVSDLIFLSQNDNYVPGILLNEINRIFKSQNHKSITLLTPYKTPPKCCNRDDGKVQSFIISNTLFNLKSYDEANGEFWGLAYMTVYNYLNSDRSNNLQVVQVDKPDSETITGSDTSTSELLKESIMIMPHKGSVKLLHRTLKHINQTKNIPAVINLCFDDLSYKKANNELLKNCTLYLNSPLNVGPYPSRHYSIKGTKENYIFFQDSDDISTENRFTAQLDELKKRNLDMIGSHELRIDQFSKSLQLIRFPLDVNRSLSENLCHPLFHPTALITRSAYLKTKGFSTDLRFSYDSQFLIRSYFFIKSGNIDDFLYLRFKRPNSLTTHAKTRLGSDVRLFLSWRWAVDFGLILGKKLHFKDSSLVVRKHTFKYKLQKIR